MALLSALILVVSGVGYATVGRLDSGMSSATDLSLDGQGLSGNSLDGAVDILLVGKDSRTDAKGNPSPRRNWRTCTPAWPMVRKIPTP